MVDTAHWHECGHSYSQGQLGQGENKAVNRFDCHFCLNIYAAAWNGPRMPSTEASHIPWLSYQTLHERAWLRAAVAA